MSATIPNPQQEAIVNAPIDVPLKVIAGAGTGKTQTLTNRFVRLVREEGIPPERILAITFTDKAAAEMAARIRGALAKEGQPVEQALSIYTFHAFARRLLRDHPEASGLSPDFPVLSDIPQRLILRRAFRDAAGGKLDVEGLRLDDLAELDVKSLEDVRRAALSVISRAKGHRWTPEAFEQMARDRDDRFYAALPDAATASACGKKKGVLSGEVYDHMREAGFPCRDRDICLDDEGHIRRLYYTNLQSSGVLKEGVDEGFVEQRRQSGLVLRTVTALFREYNRRLAEQGALDFDDLILKAAGLLEEHPAVQAAARDYYRYILVDEFQDTSPAQMDLIRAVAASEVCPAGCDHRNGGCDTVRPVNVTIVGDKKQAIYAWRNARKENLDRLIPCTGDDVCKPLARNYRSAHAVIDLANVIGRRVEALDPELERHRDVPGQLHVPPRFADGKAKQNKASEAAYIAERIQALAGQGTPCGDMAVLIRKAGQFRALREAFRRRNIPYVCDRSAGLLEEPVAKDALSALRAVARPHDDLSLYRLLSRPPVGLSDAALVAMRYRDGAASNGSCRELRPLSEAMDGAPEGSAAAMLRERLSALRRAAARLPLPAFLEALPALAGFDAAWDEDDRALWPQVLSTLQAAAAEADQMAPAASVEDFLDLLDAYDDEDDAALPVPPTEAEGVRVMTIHKSKGLEFPVVFVPSIRSARKGDPGWTWDDDWGLLPDFAEGESAKRTVASWLRRQREVAEDEEDRCWYVAATRAENYLCVTAIESNRRSTLPADLAGRDTDAHDPAGWADTVTVRRREDGEAPDLSPRPTEGTEMRIARTVSFSALGLFQTCRVASWIQRVWRFPEELIAPSGGNGTGRRVGDLFHLAAAHWYAGERDGLPDALFGPGDSDEVREGVRRRWERFVADVCAAWTPLSIERRIHLRHPTAFGDLDVNGFIDLVLPDAGEGVVLADLKTNHRLDDAHVDGYALQLALYRMALVAAGEDVAETGILVHATPEGVEAIPVRLPDHEARLRALLEDYAEMTARGVTPGRPDGADCGGCGYRDLCPRSGEDGDGEAGDTAVPEVATTGSAEAPDLDLFDEAWHPLILALSAVGHNIEPGDEVRDGTACHGISVGVVTGPDGAVALIDAEDEHADAAVAYLRRSGTRAVALHRGDTLEAWRDALEGSEI